jgi:hypothetical protein
MSTNRLFYLLMVGLLVAIIPLAACSSPAALQPTATTAPRPTATADAKQALVGSWTSTVTKEDIMRVVPGFEAKWLCDNSGTFVWKFNADGTFTIDQTALPDCPLDASAVPHVEDKWTLEGNILTFAKGTPDQEIYEITVDSDHLTFVKAQSSGCIPCIAVNTANPWTRVE